MGMSINGSPYVITTSQEKQHPSDAVTSAGRRNPLADLITPAHSQPIRRHSVSKARNSRPLTSGGVENIQLRVKNGNIAAHEDAGIPSDLLKLFERGVEQQLPLTPKRSSARRNQVVSTQTTALSVQALIHRQEVKGFTPKDAWPAPQVADTSSCGCFPCR